MEEVEKELQDQQSTLESQKSTLENQQREIEELKLAVKMNSFSEAGRVFDTVFKPPPTIAEEAEEEVKEEEEKTSIEVYLSCQKNLPSTTYHFQETPNDIVNTDDLEKELAEIVIDAPPVILAEVG